MPEVFCFRVCDDILVHVDLIKLVGPSYFDVHLQLATVEAKSFRERNVYVVLVPNKAVQPKAQEQPKKKETSDAVDEVSASL